jgi:hypothetical protein
MSAFVVTQDHIAALVNAAELHARKSHGTFQWTHDDTHYELATYGDDEEWTDYQKWGENVSTTHRRRMTLQTLGQMLYDTCLRSVFYRYSDCMTVADLPGYTPDLTERGASYVHNAHLFVSEIAALKAIDCYEYQSCEFPEWPVSCAQVFCQQLREELVTDLPGYDDAPWEILEKEATTQAVRQ